MNCNDAHTLIGPYLDGELSETQAAPLRRHLLACVGCRTGVQEHKDLQRWFVEPAVNVLTLTSVAAAATILVVLAARDNRLPDGDGLRAAERPQISMDTARERLDALQRAEAAQVRKP